MTEQRLNDLDLAGWQSVLDRNAPIFLGMQAGSRIGLMSKDDFEPPDATMVVWEATDHAMRAKYECFPGFDQVKIDLLFIADDATIRLVHDAANPRPFADIKAKVRRRDILLYVVKPRQELLDWGYEEFLDSLGLVFMGTCR
jgi:uncharacterized membrane protein (UPF0127 family)